MVMIIPKISCLQEKYQNDCVVSRYAWLFKCWGAAQVDSTSVSATPLRPHWLDFCG
jgi:hypothetical protein